MDAALDIDAPILQRRKTRLNVAEAELDATRVARRQIARDSGPALVVEIGDRLNGEPSHEKRVFGEAKARVDLAEHVFVERASAGALGVDGEDPPLAHDGLLSSAEGNVENRSVLRRDVDVDVVAAELRSFQIEVECGVGHGDRDERRPAHGPAILRFRQAVTHVR